MGGKQGMTTLAARTARGASKVRYEKHPVYRSDELVRMVTEEIMRAGTTVFQLFQFGGGERAHSLRLLDLAFLPPGAKVLSLGSGVGGMEKYWHDVRKDLEFELVNLSGEQLKLLLCPGRKVQADAEGYVSDRRPFDCVILAYMLGHVAVRKTLESAFENLRPGGTLLITDVFDSQPLFDSEMLYTSPQILDVLKFIEEKGVCCRSFFRLGMPSAYAAKHISPGVLVMTSPAVFFIERNRDAKQNCEAGQDDGRGSAQSSVCEEGRDTSVRCEGV